jgi:hypothetical protein
MNADIANLCTQAGVLPNLFLSATPTITSATLAASARPWSLHVRDRRIG